MTTTTALPESANADTAEWMKATSSSVEVRGSVRAVVEKPGFLEEGADDVVAGAGVPCAGD
jgi:hypothetical protein